RSANHRAQAWQRPRDFPDRAGPIQRDEVRRPFAVARSDARWMVRSRNEISTVKSCSAFLVSLLPAIAGVSATARAEVKLPALISDHMVVQTDASAAIWGWASPGEQVSVSLAGE